MSRNIVCVISGPTASGKTQSSLELAKRFPLAEIVNFDSLLFYRELNIGTAKPSAEEMAGVPHHMIDIRSAKAPINAADYAKMALDLIADLHAQGKIPILTGGSGFYLQALLYGMFDSMTVDPLTRKRSNELYQEKGIDPFIKILELNDPESHKRYHSNDHYRIRRAVEHFWTAGTKFSEEREVMMADREENSNIRRLNWKLFHVHLDLPKEDHFKIIQKRTASMLKQGLIQEVQDLLASGFTGKEKPLQSIGYKETIQYLHGQLDLTQLEERINISTRQLAKSQRTWFKKIEKREYNPLINSANIIEDFESFLNRL